MKYSFLNDYSEGCHPTILTKLTNDNMQQQMGYGADDICQQASNLFKAKMQQSDASIYYLTVGTQTNLICLASMLKPFEAIIASDIGHIVTNEAGAIEATGHKIISVPHQQGKITVDKIANALSKFNHFPHTVRPKVVYVTNATELGTVYTKDELTNISKYCREHDLYLFIDGARLAHALASEKNDMTLADIAELADMFWFGGTKNGALLGEVVIITNDELKADFAFHIKQRGALLAKGRVLGTQFTTLLTDDLYLQLATHANNMATKLADAIIHAGYKINVPTESNQVFAVLPQALINHLQEHFVFYEWEKMDDGSNNTVVRLVTSWATIEDQVDSFINHLQCWLSKVN